ncbi:MAG TPA: Crp/Fnr family transcriptional regulator [Pyrinomonadaceae bacterium]|jgi:CRP/FNR family transcriptional regulator
MAVAATSLSCSAGGGTQGGGQYNGSAARRPPEGAERNGHRLQLFDGLGPGDMAEITAAARSLRKGRGEFVYMPGDPAEAVYVLKKGRVKLSVLSETGKEFAIDIFQPGDIFGELALVDNTTRSNMVQTLDDALMWVFGKRDFLGLLETHPKLAINYIRLVGGRRRRMEKKLSDITTKDVAARVCELLHEISTTSAAANPPTPELLVPLTHQDVASLIGASRQTTTTVLNDLERRGIIELGRGWIRVTHLKELQVYVGSLVLAFGQIIFHHCQLADILLAGAPT